MAAVHGLVMIVALSAVIGHLSFRAAGQFSGGKAGGGKKRLIMNVFILIAVAVFVTYNTQLLAKAWKSIVGEKLAGALQVPLRVAAIIAATVPRDREDGDEDEGHGGGTPGAFAMFQTGALAAWLSAEIAS